MSAEEIYKAGIETAISEAPTDGDYWATEFDLFADRTDIARRLAILRDDYNALVDAAATKAQAKVRNLRRKREAILEKLKEEK